MQIHQLYRIVARDDGDEYYALLGLYSSEQNVLLAKLRAEAYWKGDTERGRIETHIAQLDRVGWETGFGNAFGEDD